MFNINNFTGLMNTLDAGIFPVPQQAYQQPTVGSLMQDPGTTTRAEGLFPSGYNNASNVRAPAHLEDIINEAAATYRLDPALIRAVIKQESNFNPGAVSYAGAGGYMQLMPDTAEELGVTDVFDARQNIFGGAKYLRKQIDKFGDYRHALAAYNAGPGNVRKYGGVPPFKETQNYVNKVLGYWGYK